MNDLRRKGVAIRPAAIITLGIVAVLAIYGIYDTGRLMGIAESERGHGSAAQDLRSIERVEGYCARLSHVDRAECIRETLAADRAGKLSEQGLMVQVRMAAWTFWMVMVAALSLVVTALGLWFVRKTLLQTEKTNAAALGAARAAHKANEIMRSQSRPWIAINHSRDCMFSQESDASRYDIRWKFTITNMGKMPAHHVRVSWDVCRYDPKRRGLIMGAMTAVSNRAARAEKSSLPVLFPDEAINFNPKNQKPNRLKGSKTGDLFVILSVSYTHGELRDQKAATFQVYRLEKDTGISDRFAFRLLRIRQGGYSRFE